MNDFFCKVSELQKVAFLWNDKHYAFSVLREDLLHPQLSGNKFRKLYGWLCAFLKNDAKSIATMGGAYSNHVAALAFFCVKFKIPLKVYCPNGSAKSTLFSRLQKVGVFIKVVERDKFRQLRLMSNEIIDSDFWIPEGGKGENAKLGFNFLKNHLTSTEMRKIFVCAGTGSTAMAFANLGCKVSACLAVNDFSVCNALQANAIETIDAYKIVKFGKINSEILEFSASFYMQTGVLLDPVYQSKSLMMLCNENQIDNNDVFVHTGGLQGWEGYSTEFKEYFGTEHKTKLFNTFENIFSH